jgi:protein-tyrosine-phosphatase
MAAGDAVEVRSAGSLPAEQINPAAVEAMAEVGIGITNQRPKGLTTDAVEASDVVITMGCGDVCPIFPGKRYLDWALEDPAGKGVESVRRSATRSNLASVAWPLSWCHPRLHSAPRAWASAGCRA